MTFLSEAFFYARRIRSSKSTIRGKILLKWGNILYRRGELEDALAVLAQVDRYQSGILEDVIRLQIELLRGLDRKKQLEELIKTTYNENSQSKEIRRLCVEYYKETENWEILTNLKGYNFKKDRLQEKPKEEEEHPFYHF